MPTVYLIKNHIERGVCYRSYINRRDLSDINVLIWLSAV